MSPGGADGSPADNHGGGHKGNQQFTQESPPEQGRLRDTTGPLVLTSPIRIHMASHQQRPTGRMAQTNGKDRGSSMPMWPRL